MTTIPKSILTPTELETILSEVQDDLKSLSFKTSKCKCKNSLKECYKNSNYIPVNSYYNKESQSFVIDVLLAGIDTSKLEVYAEDRKIFINYNKDQKKEESLDVLDLGFHVINSVSKIINLPKEANDKEISVKNLKNGVIQIVIEKDKNSIPRKIPIS